MGKGEGRTRGGSRRQARSARQRGVRGRKKGGGQRRKQAAWRREESAAQRGGAWTLRGQERGGVTQRADKTVAMAGGENRHGRGRGEEHVFRAGRAWQKSGESGEGRGFPRTERGRGTLCAGLTVFSLWKRRQASRQAAEPFFLRGEAEPVKRGRAGAAWRLSEKRPDGRG